MDQESSSQQEYDPFINNLIYPDASAVFAPCPEPVQRVIDSCFIVLDTNALLVLYKTGKASLEQVAELYRRLVAENRFIIPAQVAREFANVRTQSIKELFQRFSKNRQPENIRTDRFPLLESFEEYEQLLGLQVAINRHIDNYRKSVAQVVNIIKSWHWNDPVTQMYSSVISPELVVEPDFDKEQLLADLHRRQIHKIPPGYKDASKDDRGIGDLLIWYTILQEGAKRKQDVLFISGDEKSDWYVRSERQTLCPRYELVAEYRHKSNGNSFYMMSFSDFLERFGVSQDVVKAIREEELSEAPLSVSSGKSPPDGRVAANSVQRWLEHNYPDKEITSPVGDFNLDFIIHSPKADDIGVRIKKVNDLISPDDVKNLETEASRHIGDRQVTWVLVILIAPTEPTAQIVSQFLEKNRSGVTHIAFLVGYIDEQDNLFPVYFV